MNKLFTGYLKLNDEDCGTAPFGDSAYLYIEQDNGATCEAYKLDDDAPLDLQTLINAALPTDFVYEIIQSIVIGSPNYAAIITDGRAPLDGIVWSDCDFHIVEDF